MFTVTATELNGLAQLSLKMDKSDLSAKRRMQLLFLEYHSLLRVNGLKWVTERSPKAANKPVDSTVGPAQLRTRLEHDLKFSHHDLRASFDEFTAHSLVVSAGFEELDRGSPKYHKLEKDSTKAGNPDGMSVHIRVRQVAKLKALRRRANHRQLHSFFHGAKRRTVLIGTRSALSIPRTMRNSTVSRQKL